MSSAPDADLRNRLRGEPGVTPEDTRSELLQDGEDKILRSVTLKKLSKCCGLGLCRQCGSRKESTENGANQH